MVELGVGGQVKGETLPRFIKDRKLWRVVIAYVL